MPSSFDESEDEEKRFRITPTQHMISSCTGALVTAILVTPLDVVKIRLQSQQKQLPSKRCFLYCNGLMDHVCQHGKKYAWVNKPSPEFSSTMDAFRKIVRNEGVLALWSGLPPTLIMAIPSTVMYYVSYETLRVEMVDKYKVSTGKSEYPIYLPVVAACLARLGNVTLFNPLELIRTKMQAKKTSYRELRTACVELYNCRGLRGFWLGYIPNIIRDIPFSAIYWGCYEWEKKIFNMQQTQDTPLIFGFGAGAVAGSVAGVVTLPFDVIKTKRQIQMGDVDFKVKDRKLATGIEIAGKIYRQSGITGFFAGMVPRMVKVAPSCAIMICAYEYGKSFFGAYNKRMYDMQQKE